ncbi:hypothetical protein LOTGIDRAFT_233685 [Lottia gigantea]|uniref:Exocyst complex component Sec3 PIP2-binding N-terminal domain-containing protein n=1 Tax=Lottia gigantea TaxID=225164 RepID=V4A6M0_LOTGI|nr:hypothetical protein LOTGIDRAFT_233685 [Lottia gigantea]ESO90675.1 hypothetical protein LOTGIDRAFT_233685 [Lottia gigantea]
MAAAIKHTLQRDLFLPNDERLISLINVYKPPRKRKGSYLCAVLNTTDSPIRVFIYQVKKTDRGDGFKKKLSWLLRDLRTVDGKSAEKETPEFDLHFEKIYSWATSGIEEKESFLASLWRLSQRYLIQKPSFVNIPQHLMQDVNQPLDQNTGTTDGDDISIEDEDYQALSSKEESDLERLMSSCQAGIANAEVFAEKLSKELSVLDGANIHSIMGSEDQVLNLMRLLDDGIKQAETVEQQLNSYDQILENVKEQMEVMRDKDMLMTIRNKNLHQLTESLESIVSQMDLDIKHMSALLDGDLSTPNGIYECVQAAQALHRCMNIEMNPALKRLGAVEEQQKKFNKISSNFSKRLSQHLNNLFIHQGNQMAESLSRFSGELKMLQHESVQKQLIIYSDLMFWLKNTDPVVFDCLSEVYADNLSKLYTREVQEFLECAKQRVTGKADKGKHGIASVVSGSSTSLEKMSSKLRGRSPSMQSVDSLSVGYGSETDIANRGFFDSILEKVFTELERVCLAEQDFCDKFFHLSESLVAEGLKVRRQMNDGVRQMLLSLFPTLEQDLDSFITFADSKDGLYSMYMLVRMGQHVINTQDVGSFLSMTFGNCLVKVKRNFDKYIQSQIRMIEDAKVSKKNRCGIISFVHSFEDFANLAEHIFRGSERRTDLEKAYTKLVNVVFEQIVRVAKEHQKTPKDVVLMENFHRMYCILSQLKVACLEGEKKESRAKYTEHLALYTAGLLGIPLEKLHIFFEGVQARIATGVKPEEVGYQLAFSKQELRKVIKDYPAKEVKKILDHMYKKVEKQLSEEENLLQVVWREMQNLFINQYKHYDDLMKKCYPDSQISLDFSIEDVLQYFSDIAQSH